MATYAVGDIQGCYDQLRTGLDLLRFDPSKDQLWLVGDLVNRGPNSLEVLRFVKGLGDSAVAVLGNHDLHLLAAAYGSGRKSRHDTFKDVLEAPDRDELLTWLRYRPLLHRDKKLDFTMIHAGLPPQWSVKKAAKRAQEVEHVLRGKQYAKFFADMYGNEPALWSKDLDGMDRLRFITNSLTRLRYCHLDGELALDEKHSPQSKHKSNVMPWFEHPERASAKSRIVFGHWSTLGYRAENNVWSIDTGCLWGGSLTFLRLDYDEPQAIQIPCERVQDPNDFL